MNNSAIAALCVALLVSGCQASGDDLAAGDYDTTPECEVELLKINPPVEVVSIQCPDYAPFPVCVYGAEADGFADCDPSGHIHCRRFTEHGEQRGEALCCSTPDCY